MWFAISPKYINPFAFHKYSKAQFLNMHLLSARCDRFVRRSERDYDDDGWRNEATCMHNTINHACAAQNIVFAIHALTAIRARDHAPSQYALYFVNLLRSLSMAAIPGVLLPLTARHFDEPFTTVLFVTK